MKLAQTLLILIAAACILGIGVGLWRVLDTMEAVVNQGRLMLQSVRGTTLQIHRAAQDGVKQQERAVAALEAVAAAAARNLDRLGDATTATLTRLAARLDATAETVTGQVGAVLAETSATIRAGRDEISATAAEIRASISAGRDGLSATLADARGVLIATRDGVRDVTSEAADAVAGVRPLLDAGTGTVCEATRAVAAGADLAEWYSQKIMHPRGWDRVKSILTLIGFGASNIYYPIWIATH